MALPLLSTMPSTIVQYNNTQVAFDPKGQRVSMWQATSSTPTLIEAATYWNGQMVSHFDGTGTTFTHYNAFGTKRTETSYKPVFGFFDDWTSTYTSLPFGDGYGRGYGNSGQDKDQNHFGQLDGGSDTAQVAVHAQFRDYYVTAGRWLSPDPYDGSYHLLLRDIPKFRLSKAPGRDRMIDERAEDDLEQAYLEPVGHGRIKRLRQQAWLVVVILQDSGMRPDEVFPMRIENIYWDQNRIWVPEGKTDNATRFVPMSDRMKTMLRAWCGSRREGWVLPSSRSKSGHLTTIAKGFQAARGRAGLDKKVVPYSARHTYGTYTMEKSGNAFAVSKSMGHADLKSMEPYQHQELEPLRTAINQRNQRKKFGQVFGQVLENAS